MSIFKNKRLFVLPFLLLALIFFVFGCGDTLSNTSTDPTISTTETVDVEQTDNNQNADEPASFDEPADEDKSTTLSGQLKVHIIDVGQGDAILVQFHSQNMLVDAGPDDSVVSYLNQQGIKKIDYLIATHPHADHIGGMAAVIRSFDIGKIYMPKVSHTTKTFENTLQAVKSKGLKVSTAKSGVTILNQNGTKANFIAPCSSSYDNLNNYSAVIKIQHGNTSFLLAGDAEAESEQEMLASGTNLKADVLKVGHHGSNSSTTPSFLKAISPKYAVISCGTGNQYGHPHKELLNKLSSAGIQTYRTDVNGTVIFTSDGKTLTVKTLGNAIQPRAPNASDNKPSGSSQAYIGNKNSKKFHKPTCSTLPAEQAGPALSRQYRQ